jgi:hypothetical protein
MGGGKWEANPTLLNDIWSSTDGLRWELVTEHAEWKGRLWASAVVYRDAIWLIGGRYETDRDSRRIWRSADGRRWEWVQGPSEYKGRHAPSVLNFKDNIWIAGGTAGRVANDVWAFHPSR